MADAVIWFLIGAGAGSVYFLLMLKSVQRHAGGAGGGRILLSASIRLAVAATAFLLVARFAGAASVIAMLAGFLLARLAVQGMILAR